MFFSLLQLALIVCLTFPTISAILTISVKGAKFFAEG